MEGDLARTIEANIGRIGHFQVADNPGRHEPGTGEINYDYLFRLIDRLGYPGWVGCEYNPLNPLTTPKPQAGATAGLDWMKRMALAG